MSTTQEHISIRDIQNDILLLKNGGGAMVLQVSAVNFGLLSDREQIAVISSFAQMLNSLSFSIQIIIVSQRLDITSYLTLLDKAQKAQSNPLLSQMITKYKQFIQATIRENEVLDKNFYIIIPLFNIELGLTVSKESLEQKIKTVLMPRRDQVIRQLGRVGLKATQLTKQRLVEVFYNIYNGTLSEKASIQLVSPSEMAVKLNNPKPPIPPAQQNTANQENPRVAEPVAAAPQTPAAPTSANEQNRSVKSHPFVVEELEE